MQRHTRAHARFHRDRIIRKRIGFLKRTGYSYVLEFRPVNQFATKHPLDCGHSNCGVCRDTWSGNKRTREKREWQKIVEAAY